MGTIPLPALHVNPPAPAPDPLEQYGRLMWLQNMQQQQQTNQQLRPLQIQAAQTAAQQGTLDVQKSQQDLRDQQGIANWFKNIDPKADPASVTDPVAVGRTLAQQGVSGGAIMKVQAGILQQHQTLATLTKDELTNKQTISDNLANGINGVIGETDPAKRTAALTPLIQTAAQSGLLPVPAAQQMLANPGAITDDQLKQFQKGLGVSAAFTQAAARQTSAQTEKDKLAASMNPQSSLYAPSAASVSLGTAPGAAQIQAGQSAQAARTAGAEESARLPGEMQLAAQRQALMQGDPKAAGHLLTTGEATLSELKTRGATPQFIEQALQAASQESGGKYNAMQADAAFQVAKSQANVAFFGSSKSLTDPGGTLDQLAQVGKTIPQNQIPAFNSVADWEKAATGSGPLAHYAATALGVADDYAKVMGGGQGSDTSRLQALQIINKNLSPEGRAAAIDGIRNAVTSQTNSRIGANPILQRMYGNGTGQPTQPSAPSSAPASSQSPKMDQVKTFPNGKVGKWDGTGWVAQ
jgi:hypothetical protein